MSDSSDTRNVSGKIVGALADKAERAALGSDAVFAACQPDVAKAQMEHIRRVFADASTVGATPFHSTRSRRR